MNKRHILLIILLGIFIYANSMFCSFHYDDVYSIVENEAIRSLNPKPIWEFQPRRFIGYYTFALNYAVSEYNVWSYHLVNIAIHILCSILVYALVLMLYHKIIYIKEECYEEFWQDHSTNNYWRKMPTHDETGVFFALGCALLFLCHPIQTQAVTYIVQRLASLSTLLYLLTVYLFLKERWYYTCVALLSLMIAMFVKETSITVPFILLLLLLMTKRSTKKSFLLFLPTLLIVPYILSFQVMNLMAAAPSHRFLDPPLTMGTYVMTQFKVIPKYLQVLLCPVNQSIDHDIPASLSLSEPATLAGVAFCIVLLWLVWRFRHRRMILFGSLWVMITMSVECLKPLHNVMFEHRLYLPMFGVTLIAMDMLVHIVRNPEWQKTILIVLIIILSCATIMRNAVWTNDMTLWEDTVRKSPYKSQPAYALGLAYYNDKNWDKTVQWNRKAIELHPYYSHAHNNLANGLIYLGLTDSAILHYESALKYDEYNKEAQDNIKMARILERIENSIRYNKNNQAHSTINLKELKQKE